MKLPYTLEKFINKKFSSFYSEIIITVKDKNNKIVSVKKMIGHSLTENFLSIIYIGFNNGVTSANFGFTAPHASNHTLFDISNIQTSNSSPDQINIDAVIGEANKGIALGSGSTTPQPLDYSLESPIAHGTGAGQLQYGDVYSTNGVTISGATSSLIIGRTFVNNSGGPIDVSEVVLYGKTSTTPFLIYRDIFTTRTINDSQSITIDIQLNITT